MLTAQALAQHERVLRANGDDESEAQYHAMHEGLECE